MWDCWHWSLFFHQIVTVTIADVVVGAIAYLKLNKQLGWLLYMCMFIWYFLWSFKTLHWVFIFLLSKVFVLEKFRPSQLASSMTNQSIGFFGHLNENKVSILVKKQPTRLALTVARPMWICSIRLIIIQTVSAHKDNQLLFYGSRTRRIMIRKWKIISSIYRILFIFSRFDESFKKYILWFFYRKKLPQGPKCQIWKMKTECGFN